MWNKPSSGDDHFHYALLYTWPAAQIRVVASRGFGMAPMVGSFS